MSRLARTPKPEPVYDVVPKSWPGAVVVILASGPSLTQDDVDYCQGRARVIAIKDTVKLAPWADLLYCGDEVWWREVGPSITFAGERYALVIDQSQRRAAQACSAKLLRYAGQDGIETQPNALRSGNHSGYQAIQLAVHLGASTIVLLGYDMQPSVDGRDHFFGKHQYTKKPAPYAFLRFYESMKAPLHALGVMVVNSSRASALTAFPQVPLAEALAS